VDDSYRSIDPEFSREKLKNSNISLLKRGIFIDFNVLKADHTF
jgi:hypothetical protein